MNWDAIGCVIALVVVSAPYVAGVAYAWRNPPPPWRDPD